MSIFVIYYYLLYISVFDHLIKVVGTIILFSHSTSSAHSKVGLLMNCLNWNSDDSLQCKH